MAVAGESIILQGLATPTTDLMAVAGESIIFQGLSTPTTDLMEWLGRASSSRVWQHWLLTWWQWLGRASSSRVWQHWAMPHLLPCTQNTSGEALNNAAHITRPSSGHSWLECNLHVLLRWSPDDTWQVDYIVGRSRQHDGFNQELTTQLVGNHYWSCNNLSGHSIILYSVPTAKRNPWKKLASILFTKSAEAGLKKHMFITNTL